MQDSEQGVEGQVYSTAIFGLTYGMVAQRIF